MHRELRGVQHQRRESRIRQRRSEHAARTVDLDGRLLHLRAFVAGQQRADAVHRRLQRQRTPPALRLPGCGFRHALGPFPALRRQRPPHDRAGPELRRPQRTGHRHDPEGGIRVARGGPLRRHPLPGGLPHRRRHHPAGDRPAVGSVSGADRNAAHGQRPLPDRHRQQRQLHLPADRPGQGPALRRRHRRLAEADQLALPASVHALEQPSRSGHGGRHAADRRQPGEIPRLHLLRRRRQGELHGRLALPQPVRRHDRHLVHDCIAQMLGLLHRPADLDFRPAHGAVGCGSSARTTCTAW